MAWRPTHWIRRNRFWRFYRISRLLFTTLWIITRERSRVVKAQERGEFDVGPDIEELRRALREFRKTAVALGGLLIKLGQFLSARADLLPQEALDELTTLQDEVPAESFRDIERAIERELNAPLRDVFANINPIPAGAASLGQVHRATLLDGRSVAVKVQRPGIDEIVRADLRAIRFVLQTVQRLFPAMTELMDLPGLYKEFSKTVYEELDYQHEGRNAERFARLFAEEPDIRVPAIYWEHTRKRILMLEWMDGIKVSNVEAIAQAGIDNNAVALRLVETYFKQVLDMGYFHADPHPGNIMVQPAENGFEIVYVDFGMMGNITRDMKAALRDCLLGVVTNEPLLVVRGVDALGFLAPNANRKAIERAIASLLEQYANLPFGEIRGIDPKEVFSEIEELLYDQPFRLPTQFAFLGRMLGMLVGLATSLSPDFNLIDAATPYTRKMAQGGALGGMMRLMGAESTEQLGRIVAREGLAVVRSLSSLPRLAERVLEQVERGELHVTLNANDAPGKNGKNGKNGRIGPLTRPVPAWVPMGIAGAAVLTLAVQRRGHRG